MNPIKYILNTQSFLKNMNMFGSILFPKVLGFHIPERSSMTEKQCLHPSSIWQTNEFNGVTYMGVDEGLTYRSRDDSKVAMPSNASVMSGDFRVLCKNVLKA